MSAALVPLPPDAHRATALAAVVPVASAWDWRAELAGLDAALQAFERRLGLA